MHAQPGQPSSEPLITGDLVKRAKDGDQRAMSGLMARHRPRLERWTSGRLPHDARSLLDTSDLVQETLPRAIEGLDLIVEVRGPGFFQADFEEIAAVMGRTSRDAARMAVQRSLRKLAEIMGHAR